MTNYKKGRVDNISDKGKRKKRGVKQCDTLSANARNRHNMNTK